MHIPFSMSDEPDLGDEFSGYTLDEDTSHEQPTTTIYTQSEADHIIRKLIQKSLEMRDEAYAEGYQAGLRSWRVE